MKRSLLIIAFTLSVLLCAATAVLWIRSDRGNGLRFRPTPGEVLVIHDGTAEWYHYGWFPQYELWRIPAGLVLLWLIPLFWRYLRNAAGVALLAVLIHAAACPSGQPLAVPFVLLFDVIWIGAVLASLAKPRAPRPGFCVVCGYDLRATPDRCPECGTVVSMRTGTAT